MLQACTGTRNNACAVGAVMQRGQHGHLRRLLGVDLAGDVNGAAGEDLRLVGGALPHRAHDLFIRATGPSAHQVRYSAACLTAAPGWQCRHRQRLSQELLRHDAWSTLRKGSCNEASCIWASPGMLNAMLPAQPIAHSWHLQESCLVSKEPGLHAQ
jgi:hypothetical protein